MVSSSRNAIWPIGGNNYILYSENERKLKRILRWKGVEIFNEHFYHGGKFRSMQIVFSSRHFDRIADVFGLPRKKKSPGRVDQGKKISRINSVPKK